MKKHLPLLIKTKCFALSRRVGFRPGEQICKGLSATVLQHRLLMPNSSPLYRQQVDTGGSHATLYRAPCRNAVDVGEKELNHRVALVGKDL